MQLHLESPGGYIFWGTTVHPIIVIMVIQHIWFYVPKQCVQQGLYKCVNCKIAVAWEGWALTLGHFCGE